MKSGYTVNRSPLWQCAYELELGKLAATVSITSNLHIALHLFALSSSTYIPAWAVLILKTWIELREQHKKASLYTFFGLLLPILSLENMGKHRSIPSNLKPTAPSLQLIAHATLISQGAEAASTDLYTCLSCLLIHFEFLLTSAFSPINILV